MGSRNRGKRRKEKEAGGEKASLWTLLAAAVEGEYPLGSISTIHAGKTLPARCLYDGGQPMDWPPLHQVSLAGPIT